MSEGFDPYLEWLGIPPEEQPPHHYRLLGVRVFENDTKALDQAADARMAQLRTAQIGKRAALSQKLLNEVAAARACLVNPRRRAAYDAELKRRFGERQIAAAPTPGASGQLRVIEPLESGDGEDTLTEFDIASLPPLNSSDPLGPGLTDPAPTAAQPSAARPSAPAPQQPRPQTPQPAYAAGKPAAPHAGQPGYGAPGSGAPAVGASAYYPSASPGIQVSLRAVVLFFVLGIVLLFVSLIVLVLLLVFLPRGSRGGGTFGTDISLATDQSIGADNGLGDAPSAGDDRSAPFGREAEIVIGLSQTSNIELDRGMAGDCVVSHDGRRLVATTLSTVGRYPAYSVVRRPR